MATVRAATLRRCRRRAACPSCASRRTSAACQILLTLSSRTRIDGHARAGCRSRPGRSQPAACGPDVTTAVPAQRASTSGAWLARRQNRTRRPSPWRSRSARSTCSGDQPSDGDQHQPSWRRWSSVERLRARAQLFSRDQPMARTVLRAPDDLRTIRQLRRRAGSAPDSRRVAGRRWAGSLRRVGVPGHRARRSRAPMRGPSSRSSVFEEIEPPASEALSAVVDSHRHRVPPSPQSRLSRLIDHLWECLKIGRA